MRFFSGMSGAATALGMAALLSGCSVYESSTSWLDRRASSAFETTANVGTRITPWGGTQPASPGESLTVQRVRNEAAAAEPLLPEDGNVWPPPEPPRATLMNPDQALRGIAGYAPGMPATQPQQSAEPSEPPRSQRRGSGGPFVPAPTSGSPDVPQPQSALPPLAPLAPVPASSGQSVLTPQGYVSPSTSSGNTATFNTGTGVGGTIVRDGNTTTINRPGEAPQMIPTPR